MKAKNLIPTFRGDPVLNVDCYVDGSLFLLTFKEYLLLMPTIQDNKSAFMYTFRKDSKPGLTKLGVNKKDLLNNNVTELNFKNAQFDEKSQF